MLLPFFNLNYAAEIHYFSLFCFQSNLNSSNAVKKKNKKINVIETKISKLFFFFFSFKRIAQQEAYL